MENRAHAIAAGIFVIAMGLATVFAAWFFAGKRESDVYLLETHRSVTGLNVQAQVRYRGIRAGKVESIDRDPADPRIILVKIGLDPRFKLTRATTAKLGYQGITGLAFVDIEDDGSSTDVLPVDDGHPPRLSLKPGLVETLGEKAGDIVTQIGEVAARLNRVFDERNAVNLARTLDNAADASEGLKELPRILAAMRAALSDENLKRLDGILAHMEKTAGEAAPLTAETRELVKSMTAASQKLDRIMGAGGGEFSSSTLPQVGALVKQLNANSNQLGRILDMLEERPQSLLFGRGVRQPGPGEAGFAVPPATEK